MRNLALPIFFAALALAAPAQVSAQTRDAPAPRAHHAMVYDPAGGRVLLAGGSTPTRDGHRFFDDLWAWDGTGWRALPVTGPEQSGQRLAFDPATGSILSLGGFRGRAALAHLLVLEPGADAWRERPFPEGRPTAEGGFVRDARGRRFLAFGGTGNGGVTHGDTWALADGAWTRLYDDGPPPRHSFVMAYDSARGVTVVFGGMDAAGALLADTWIHDGRSWRQVGDAAGPAPSPRAAMAFAYDTRRARLVVFGGVTGHGFAGDTWAWDGAAWTLLAEDGPGPRAIAAMAYDAARDRVVLFGGRRTGPMRDLDDTWEWDGESWTCSTSCQRAPTPRGPSGHRGLDSAVGIRPHLITTPTTAFATSATSRWSIVSSTSCSWW